LKKGQLKRSGTTEDVAVTIFAPLFEMSITWHSAIVRSCSFIHADRWRFRRISRTKCFIGFGILQICPRVKTLLKGILRKSRLALHRRLLLATAGSIPVPPHLHETATTWLTKD
jgi:hypothetical protein